VQYTQQAARIEQLKNLEAQKAEMMAKAEVTTALIEKVPRSILMAELVTRMPEQVALLELNLASRRLRDAPVRQQPAATQESGQVRNLGGRSQAPRRPGAATTAATERVSAPRFEYTLRLTGVAHANNQIADYLAALKACALLDKVELKYIKPATVDRAEFRQFEIEAVLRRDADARGIEPTQEIPRAMEVSRQSAGAEPDAKPTKPLSTVPEGAK
jgi:Tfp pilus assembly protein PilN